MRLNGNGLGDRLALEIFDLAPGAPLCLLYDKDPAEQMPVLVPLIEQGLAQHEQFIYIADDQAIDAVAAQLQRGGIDVPRHRARGALLLWTREQWRQPGELDSDRKAAQVRELIDAARQAGFRGIRLAVEMTNALSPNLDAARIEHWEATLNTLGTSDFPVRILCQYNRSRLSADAVIAALHTHPTVIVGEHVCPNVFFHAPSLLNGDSGAGARAEWMIAQLKQHRISALEREALVRERTRLLEVESARQKIADVLESLSDAFVGIDADGRFAFVNAAAEKLFGRRAADLLGEGGWALQVATLGWEIACACRSALEERTGIELEHFHTPWRRWLAVKIYPSSTGGLSAFFRDITAQKLNEAALHAATAELEMQVNDLRRLHDVSWSVSRNLAQEPILREILRATLEVHQADLGLIALEDGERHLLRIGVSSGFSADYLYSLGEQLPGAEACEACRRQQHRIVVEDTERDPLLEPSRETARRGGFRAVHGTPLVQRSGGTIGVLVVYFREARRPTERELQLVDLYARQAADALEAVSLREHARRELAESRRADDADRRLAAIVESSDDAIVSKDLNGRILTWNKGAQQIFGYTPAEAIGQSITMIIPPERQGEERLILSRLRAGEPIDHYETVRIRKDGVRINVSLTVSLLRDGDGNVIGASKIARDITDQKKAEAALRSAQEQLQAHAEELEQRVLERTASLREANTQMEEFSYSVSHDLRAPLRAIHTYAQILQGDYGDRLDDTARDYLQRIERNSERMEKLTQDILTYSRVARTDVALTAVDLEQLVDDLLCQHVELQASAADVEVHRPFLPVRGHETSLGQCIYNLLTNAVKFVAPGVRPHVHLRTEAAGPYVRLWVEDNGVGVPPEYQGRLFQVFERLHQRDRYEGTGIGLAIVRKAMEKMGGHYGVESDGRQGSRFWIELLRA